MKLYRILQLASLVVLLGLGAPTMASGAETIIVRLQPGAAIETVTRLLGGEVLDQIPGTQTYLVSVAWTPPAWLLLPGIESIEPNETLQLPRVLESAVLAGTAETAADWYAFQPSLQVVHSPQAREYARGGGVIVADIDSRFDLDHPALRGRFVEGYDFVTGEAGNAGLDQSSASFLFADSGSLDQSSASFLFTDDGLLDQSSASFLFTDGLLDQSSASFLFDENGLTLLSPLIRLLDPAEAAYSHGTRVAGLIVATAPDARIMPIRAFDDQGEADLFTLARAVRHAAKHGAQIINMSWGTLTDSPVLREAVEFARLRGVVMVTSAGNMNSRETVYPAAYSGVIAVAATDDSDRKASFSSFGPNVDVTAPGVNIASAYPGGLYSYASGTSFSSPIVAGEAALLYSQSASGVGIRIERNTVDIDGANPDYRGQLGEGRVDFLRAVRDRSETETTPARSWSLLGGFGW